MCDLGVQSCLELTAQYVRDYVISLRFHDKNLHMGSTLSCVEILTVLLSKYVRDGIDSKDKDWLILSKGHAAPALYVLLAMKGFIPYDELPKIHMIDSMLQGHPEVSIPGVDMSTGSLGQGLSFAVGVATWIKIRGGSGRVYVVMGDGEQDEGQVWEAMTHATALGLDNLIVIIDANGYQLDGSVGEVKPKYFMPTVWSAVGWLVMSCDGHSVEALTQVLDLALSARRPVAIFAKTVRGKGLKDIEGTELQRVE